MNKPYVLRAVEALNDALADIPKEFRPSDEWVAKAKAGTKMQSSGHTYQPPKGLSVVERLQAELAPLKAVADAAEVLVTQAYGPQVSPKQRTEILSANLAKLKALVEAWKAQP